MVASFDHKTCFYLLIYNQEAKIQFILITDPWKGEIPSNTLASYNKKFHTMF